MVRGATVNVEESGAVEHATRKESVSDIAVVQPGFHPSIAAQRSTAGESRPSAADQRRVALPHPSLQPYRSSTSVVRALREFLLCVPEWVDRAA